MAPVAAEPFWRLLDVSPAGCWLWTGYLDGEGYGQYGPSRVHRIAWSRLRGPVADGLTLDHLCRVRRCANPDHLEPVPLLVNVRRGSRAMRAACLHGHPYKPENTYTSTDSRGRTHRRCRACNREAVRRYQERVR